MNGLEGNNVMSTIEIYAAFDDEKEAQEALHKLQALRAAEVGGLNEKGLLTATVDTAVAARAMRLIKQAGGSITSDLI